MPIKAGEELRAHHEGDWRLTFGEGSYDSMKLPFLAPFSEGIHVYHSTVMTRISHLPGI